MLFQLALVRLTERLRSSSDLAAFAQALHKFTVGQRHANAVIRKRLSIWLDRQCTPSQAPRGQRGVVGDADVSFLNLVRNPVVGRVRALGDDDQFHQWILAWADAAIADQIGF